MGLRGVDNGSSGWGVVVGLEFGTIIHPKVPQRVREVVGRICATELREETLRFSFGVSGNTIEARRLDATAIIDDVLRELNLGKDSVFEAYFTEDSAVDDEMPQPPHEPHLTLVADKTSPKVPSI